MQADLHPAEAKRLNALRRYGILDTPREQEFDDVVRVAAAVCDTPIAVVNLIDEGRQWFKAEIGLGVRETPLPASICAHAILQPDLFHVPDTQLDERFRHNPLVTGDPHLRFYAGALLETPDGLPLGTICVLDRKPRELDETQRAFLRLMASQVMKLLELRRAIAAERAAREKAELLLRENAILVRESDHRVMNSLQLVSSVLALQRRGAVEPAVRAHLEDARMRVQAIATVHKQLHLAGSSSEIEIGDFLRRLGESLGNIGSDKGTAVTLVSDTALVPSEIASTLGLIVAEIVANSFKHGYVGKLGPVSVAFVKDAGWRLTVADAGVGLPPDFDAASSKGVGMRVINALVKRLDAKLSYESSTAGTAFTVTKSA